MLELNLLLLAMENKPTFIIFYIKINVIVTLVMSLGQMLLTHFIVAVICIGQMLLCQSILFFICWFMVLKNHVGTRVSSSPDVIRLCLLLL